MKILLANKFFFPKGGAETVFFQERNYLLNQGHSVIDFSMIHPNNVASPYAEFFVPNVEYRDRPNVNPIKRLLNSSHIALSFIHNKKAVQNIKRLIDKEKPVIAHLHNIYHQITPAIIPALHKAGVKVILTLHDYKIICPNYLMLTKDIICQKCEGRKFWNSCLYCCEQGSYTGSLLLTMEAYWHRIFKSYEYVDMFLAPSQFMAKLVTRFRINSEKIRILHNGIDIKSFKATGVDAGYVLYFGRLSREKGIETFLNAHAQLKGKIPAKVVGTGLFLDAVKQKFGKVDFTGFKQGGELREIIDKASFVVVPSEWYENCSMVVLESMALGKPVIGSRIGGIPEQIDDGKTGYLFEMGNSADLALKMEELARNEKLRQEMGRNARIKLENNYSLDNHNEKLVSFYKELLETE
jgi:glycosyltransferase involved in cell wall biosynthesis